MTDVNYPQPLSLKEDLGGWVVDHNIKPINTDLTSVNLRKLPPPTQITGGTLDWGSGLSPGHHRTYGREGGAPHWIAPVGFSMVTPLTRLLTPDFNRDSQPKPPSTPDLNINPIIKDIRKTCVSPGIVDSLHPVSDDSCMMLTRHIGGGSASWSEFNHNRFTPYAGENSGPEATIKHLTNEYSKVSSDGAPYDLNNIKFSHHTPTGSTARDPQPLFEDKIHGSNRWNINDVELHTYIDVEKYTSGSDVYWNDYDIWDIKRLYKTNYDQTADKDRKIWWDNLYNPYCHDMFEWVDTGLRSSDSTMRMTCGYEETPRGLPVIFNKDGESHQIQHDGNKIITNWDRVGQIDYYRGPDVAHPLHSILNDDYTIPDENGEGVSCENCKNKAAVSWDKTNNGQITGFTDILENSTFTETELRTGFSNIIPPAFSSGKEDPRYYLDDTRGTNPPTDLMQGADSQKLIPEIIGASKSSGGGVNFLAALREPVVVNITTAQAMRFCNETDNCAGFLHYRIPDNYDYLMTGNSICDSERKPDYINKYPPGGKCYGTQDNNGNFHKLSGTLTSNSWTAKDRIKNLFIFKKKIGSDDPNDPNWGPNIEADELIRPNKYVYCVGGQKNTSLPDEYENFKLSDLFENSEADARFNDGSVNKCGEYAGDWFNKRPQLGVIGDSARERDGGINQNGICVYTPTEDGTLSDWGETVEGHQDIRPNRANTYLLERCRDKKISPLIDNVSGPGSEMDTLLYRNLPAYVYKKKPRPNYTETSYKLNAGSEGSGGIYDELKADADDKITSVVSQITDRSQINGNYNSFVGGTFSCGSINDDYFNKHQIADANCTQECKNEIRWTALYNINNCDSATEASADCDCILEAKSEYSERRDICIRHNADLKEYYINKLEKQNLDDSWNYYKEGTPVNDWWDATTAVSGNDISPSRIQHPSNIYLKSLKINNLYDFTGISRLKDNWDGDGNDDNTFKGTGADGRPGLIFDPISLTCCINSIDINAAVGGNIDASNFQQCMQCSSRNSAQCSDIVDHGIPPFTDTTATHVLQPVVGTGETTFFESFADYIDDLIDSLKDLFE